jgi:hypothetical protein
MEREGGVIDAVDRAERTAAATGSPERTSCKDCRERRQRDPRTMFLPTFVEEVR